MGQLETSGYPDWRNRFCYDVEWHQPRSYSYHIIYTEGPNTYYKVRYNWVSSGVVPIPDHPGRYGLSLAEPQLLLEAMAILGWLIGRVVLRRILLRASNWGSP